MKILGIIPARYASTRFPGKPLAIIEGKSMIQRVYEQVQKAGSLTDVMVATDDDRIFQHITEFGGNVVMTSTEHPSGTDRCLEALLAYQKLNQNTIDAVICIQGDEPFIQPEHINQLASCFDNPNVEISTLIQPVTTREELFNPNVVKVVKGVFDNALYFSRSPIPYCRKYPENEWIQHHNYYKHIGIYAYRSTTLQAITRLNQGILESVESLEQLRWLENGFTIFVKETQWQSLAVDTPEDLAQVIEFARKQLS